MSSPQTADDRAEDRLKSLGTRERSTDHVALPVNGARHRRCFRLSQSVVVAVILATGNATSAEPLLRSPLAYASYRVDPPPFQVKAHHGRFQWGDGHVEFVAPGGELRWDAWRNAHDIGEPRKAIALVDKRALASESCNRYFADKMPGGRTLSEIWNADDAARVRISYSPGACAMWRAATYASAPYEWTITQTSVRLGAESIAAAMVHEAARTNGPTHQDSVVYGAGQACGMRPYVISKGIAAQLGWFMRIVK